jgi:hypothetical protein
MNEIGPHHVCREGRTRCHVDTSAAWHRPPRARRTLRVGINLRALSYAAIACVGLSACGPKETSPTPKPGASPSPDAAASTAAATAKSVEASSKAAASAAEVAANARSKLNCPAKVASPARAANAPVDDVLGVRPGMTYEEAVDTVLCTHDLLVAEPAANRKVEMNTYGQNIRHGFYARFAEPKINKSSKEIMQEMQDRTTARGLNTIVRDVKPGQAKWFVGTMGMPGSERVVNVAREEWFEDGRNPPVAQVEEALRAKYGAPSRVVNNPRRLDWLYGPEGQLISEQSLQLRPLGVRPCGGAAHPDAAVNFASDCGIVVQAFIVPMRSNPDLAESMQVGVVNSAGGYAAIASTERSLQQLDAQRRAKEVEKASKDSTKLKL